MGERLALLASALVVAALLVGTGYLFGSQIRDQLVSLSGTLPEAAQSLSRAFPNATLPDLVKGSSLWASSSP